MCFPKRGGYNVSFFILLGGDSVNGLFRKLSHGKGQNALHVLLKTDRI